MKSLGNYLSIIIGWFLGLMSAILIESYKKHHTKKSVKKGIKTELKELKLRLIAINYITVINYGEVTKKWCKWLKPYFELLINSDEFDYISKNMNFKNNNKKTNDNDFFRLIKSSQKNEPKITQIYTKITLPYINSSYHSLSLLNERFIQNITTLKRDIASINSNMEQIWFYHSKTFVGINSKNLRIVNHNIEYNSLRIAENCKLVIKLINETLNN